MRLYPSPRTEHHGGSLGSSLHCGEPAQRALGAPTGGLKICSSVHHREAFLSWMAAQLLALPRSTRQAGRRLPDSSRSSRGNGEGAEPERLGAGRAGPMAKAGPQRTEARTQPWGPRGQEERGEGASRGAQGHRAQTGVWARGRGPRVSGG